MTASWADTAAVMSAGACSQNRVASSMPVNRNVTVPDGGCTDTAGLYRLRRDVTGKPDRTKPFCDTALVEVDEPEEHASAANHPSSQKPAAVTPAPAATKASGDAPVIDA